MWSLFLGSVFNAKKLTNTSTSFIDENVEISSDFTSILFSIKNEDISLHWSFFLHKIAMSL